MRLINSRFATETKFFWNERALNLETQTTMPIKDHGEMGFSGENGDLSFDDLIKKNSPRLCLVGKVESLKTLGFHML